MLISDAKLQTQVLFMIIVALKEDDLKLSLPNETCTNLQIVITFMSKFSVGRAVFVLDNVQDKCADAVLNILKKQSWYL